MNTAAPALMILALTFAQILTPSPPLLSTFKEDSMKNNSAT